MYIKGMIATILGGAIAFVLIFTGLYIGDLTGYISRHIIDMSLFLLLFGGASIIAILGPGICLTLDDLEAKDLVPDAWRRTSRLLIICLAIYFSNFAFGLFLIESEIIGGLFSTIFINLIISVVVSYYMLEYVARSLKFHETRQSDSNYAASPYETPVAITAGGLAFAVPGILIFMTTGQLTFLNAVNVLIITVVINILTLVPMYVYQADYYRERYKTTARLGFKPKFLIGLVMNGTAILTYCLLTTSENPILSEASAIIGICVGWFPGGTAIKYFISRAAEEDIDEESPAEEDAEK